MALLLDYFNPVSGDTSSPDDFENYYSFVVKLKRFKYLPGIPFKMRSEFIRPMVYAERSGRLSDNNNRCLMPVSKWKPSPSGILRKIYQDGETDALAVSIHLSSIGYRYNAGVVSFNELDQVVADVQVSPTSELISIEVCLDAWKLDYGPYDNQVHEWLQNPGYHAKKLEIARKRANIPLALRGIPMIFFDFKDDGRFMVRSYNAQRCRDAYKMLYKLLVRKNKNRA